MYRLLIVDDEALVRRGIKNSVNWNELGIEMVAEAANGVEALSQVMENAPDIILLDINMPKMNGLEFASIVKKQYPKTKIVIITGYHDFEYARSALRVGVEDYILKPITKEDVGDIVRAQLEKLAEERADESAKVEADERKWKRDTLNAILRREQRAEVDIPVFRKAMDWHADRKVMLVLMRDYLSGCEIWNEGEGDSLAEFAILNIANEVLERYGCGFAFETYKNELALLVSCERSEAEEILDEIHGNILDFLEIPVDFAVSGEGGMKELPALAEQARTALSYAFVLSGRNIIFYQDVMRRRDKSFAYPGMLEVELLEKMFSGDMDEGLRLIDEFFAQVEAAAPDIQQCKNMLLRLFMKVSGTIEAVASRTGTEEGEAESFDPFDKLEEFSMLEEARVWLKKLYVDTYRYVSSVRSRSGQLYQKIKAYIEKNYADSGLNLKKCSEDLFLSSNYISMILKKETGKAFVDYLNDYRIQKAAEMLSGPESVVYEVSYATGFTHPTYFSSVFKKLMGVSPKQYSASSK